MKLVVGRVRSKMEMIVWALLLLFGVGFYSILAAPQSQAYYTQVADYKNRDDVRRALIDYCWGSSFCALPWLSAPSNSYYDSTINIRHDQTVVDVVIRGASYRNRGGVYETRSATLVGGSVDGHANARIGDIYPTSFHRGYFTGNGISTQGGEVRAKMYVPHDGPGYNTYRMWLHSCVNWRFAGSGFWQGTTGVGSANCDWHMYQTTVRRLAPEFNLTPRISVSSQAIEDGAVRVGSISSSVRNSGPDNSRNAAYAAVRFVLNKPVSVNTSGTIYSASTNWPLAVARGIGNRYGASTTGVKNISGNRISSIGRNSTVNLLSGGTDDLSDINGAQASSSICYATIVNNYNVNSGNYDYRYAVKCVLVSKKPKVQVWGGDIKTNNQIITGLSRFKGNGLVTKTMSTDQLKAAGLWKTGVNNGNDKLGENVADPHWSLVCAQAYDGTEANQKAYNSSGSPVFLPNCGSTISETATKYQARTLKEEGGAAGQYLCTSQTQNVDILGDVAPPTSLGTCGSYLWRKTTPAARWISLNQFGQHTNSKDRPDKSTNHAGSPLEYGNIYVFRLSNVNLGEASKASGLQLTFSGAVSNLVKVKINNQDMDTTARTNPTQSWSKFGSSEWASPQWESRSEFRAEMLPGTSLRATNNTIDIYVKSDWTHLGLLIDNISLSYQIEESREALYGSWGEYGMLARGNINSASGAGLSSNFNGRLTIDRMEYNKLSFANNPGYGSFTSSLVTGNFSIPKVSPDQANFLNGNVNVGSLNAGTYRAGNINISGTLASGKSVVINSTGTVRITGNLTYVFAGGIDQLPQLIINAKNIIIEPNVEEVNAWLTTTNDGYVSTCGAVANRTSWLSGISATSCNKRLIINGPIRSGHLFLRRTYGGQHSSPARNDKNMHPGTPAEILNLRADTYIWAYDYYRGKGVIRTMNLKELPSRY